MRADKTDPPTVIGPAAYASWRATALGVITEGIEQRLILDLMGDLAGRRVLDAGSGDGVLIYAAASRGAAATGVDPDSAMLAVARSRVGVSVLARALMPLDSRLARLTTFGAAFIAVAAERTDNHSKKGCFQQLQ